MFQLQFPNRKPIELTLVDHTYGSAPQVEFVARQPRFHVDRFAVREGDVGRLVDANPQKLKTNHTREEIEAAEFDPDMKPPAHLFMTSNVEACMTVKIVSAAFLPRDVQRDIYGRTEPIVKPSRNRGSIVVEFNGNDFNRWLGFFSVLRSKAVTNRSFVSFVGNALENGFQGIDQVDETRSVDDDDDD